MQSVQSGRVTYARAMGPMQFLPGTWARYASDGDGDGKADVQNLYDSTLAAARYLCSGGLNLRDRSQVMTAILRYNNSVAYAQNVLGWAAAYATGVVPVNLPPITGPAPLGDAHLDANPEGLGPGLPVNAAGLPATDPLALTPLLPDTAARLGVGAGAAAWARLPPRRWRRSRTVRCFAWSSSLRPHHRPRCRRHRKRRSHRSRRHRCSHRHRHRRRFRSRPWRPRPCPPRCPRRVLAPTGPLPGPAN